MLCCAFLVAFRLKGETFKMEINVMSLQRDSTLFGFLVFGFFLGKRMYYFSSINLLNQNGAYCN